MTTGSHWVPAESFVKLGPVDQYALRDELWTMWERVTGEHHASQGPPRVTAERETLLLLADALRMANQLSYVITQLRRDADSVAAWSISNTGTIDD